jgi:hypothetical protein
VKIKLDENLPDRLVPVLNGRGHSVDKVRTEQLNGRADPDVWSAAQAFRDFLRSGRVRAAIGARAPASCDFEHLVTGRG